MNRMKRHGRIIWRGLCLGALGALLVTSAGVAVQPDDPQRDDRSTNPAGGGEILEPLRVRRVAQPPTGEEKPIQIRVKRDPETNQFEVEIDDRKVESTDWLDIERAARERYENKVIAFVSESGEDLLISPKAMFGVVVEPVEGALASQLRLEPQMALLITEVFSGLPAEEAGLAPHDIIIELNGRRPVRREDLSTVLRQADPGDRVSLMALRGGRPMEVEVVLEAFDPKAMRPRSPLVSLDEYPLVYSLGEGMPGEASARFLTPSTLTPMLFRLDRTNELAPMANPWQGVDRAQREQMTTESDLDSIRERLDRIEELLQLLLEMEARRVRTDRQLEHEP